MPAAELEARLDQRFALLTGGSRAAPPRQQTLRAIAR
jgi:predicted ATPase